MPERSHFLQRENLPVVRSNSLIKLSKLQLAITEFCRHLHYDATYMMSKKVDDFNFHITNVLFLSSNIPSSPAYGVFISQLSRYARASSSYECFILRAVRIFNKLLQRYVKERLRSSRRKFYGRYGDLIKPYEVPLSRMLHDILDDDHLQ